MTTLRQIERPRTAAPFPFFTRICRPPRTTAVEPCTFSVLRHVALRPTCKDPREPLPSSRSTQDNGVLGKLQHVADGELEIEFVKMECKKTSESSVVVSIISLRARMIRGVQFIRVMYERFYPAAIAFEP